MTPKKKGLRLFDLPPWTPEWSTRNANEFLDVFNASHFMQLDDIESEIPAGYTYLGQFIAHDLSFDPRTMSSHQSIQAKELNFRTPSLDLDSIYGEGPLGNPIYYNQNKKFGRIFLYLDDENSFDIPRKKQNQHIGIPYQVALIPDHRNDDNIIVSQLHLAFMKLHNVIAEEQYALAEKEINTVASQKENLIAARKAELETLNRSISILRNNYPDTFNQIFEDLNIDHFEKEIKFSDLLRIDKKIKYDEAYIEVEFKDTYESEIAGSFNTILALSEEISKVHKKELTLLDKVFLEAKRICINYYHYIIIKDFLPRIIDKTILESILPHNLQRDNISFQIYNKTDAPILPLEFTHAAFRFGHSMVRVEYDLNDSDLAKDIFVKAPNEKPLQEIDWKLFFFEHKEGDPIGFKNFSKKINLFIVSPMINNLPVSLSSPNIVYRNIYRSWQMKLPSGQAIAKALKVEAINHDKFCSLFGKNSSIYNTLLETFPKPIQHLFKSFLDESPLWFYILMEAEYFNAKQTDHDAPHTLGPVGSRIVAEVIIGIIYSDPNSFLRKCPTWKPSKEDCNDKGEFGMIKLLRKAGVYDYNPE